MKILMILLLLCACSGGGYVWEKPSNAVPQSGIYSRKLIARQMFLDVGQVPSQYRRNDDPIAGPVYMLFNDQNEACVVSSEDFTMAREQEDWPCRWRKPWS